MQNKDLTIVINFSSHENIHIESNIFIYFPNKDITFSIRVRMQKGKCYMKSRRGTVYNEIESTLSHRSLKQIYKSATF